MLSPENTDEDIDTVVRALSSIPRRTELTDRMPALSRPRLAMTPREAMLSPSCECDVHTSVGRVLAQPSVSCPPAIPVLVCGEVIDESAVAVFEYYGIEKCRVVEDK
jgi:arginine/lysine/ornithine decarboxylase